MNFSKALWGIILILLGGLFVLENLNLIDFYWSDLVDLWPVLLILWGVSILPVKGGWKALISLLIIVGAISYTLQNKDGEKIWRFDDDTTVEFRIGDEDDADWDEDNDEDMTSMEFQKEQIPYDSNITRAYLKFDGAAGVFKIKDTSMVYLMDFQKKGNMGKYEIEPERKDSIYIVDIELSNTTIRGRNNFNEANIKLNKNPIWNIDLNLGAADARMDLTAFKIHKVEVDGGASNIDIKLGSNNPKTRVEVDAGASSFVLRIPRESGCQVQFETFLAGKDLDGFVKESRKFYHTPDYKSSKHQIHVVVEAAVSSFTVERY